MKNVVEKFLREVKVNNKENTYINYKIDLTQFVEWIKEYKGIEEVDEAIAAADFDDINEYKHYLVESFEKTSVNRKVMVLKSFYNFAKYSLKLECNPMEGVKGFKVEHKEKEFISVDEVKKIIELTMIRESNERNFLFNSKRNRFLIALLVTNGLRIEEALGIKFKDLEICDEGKFYMVNLKGDRIKNELDKRVPIANKVLEYFKEYLVELEKISTCSGEDYLFISSKGKKLTTKASNDMIQKYAGRLNEDIKITNHSLRHTCNAKLISDGVSSILIDNLLGWKAKGSMSATVYFHNTFELDQKKVQITNFL